MPQGGHMPYPAREDDSFPGMLSWTIPDGIESNVSERALTSSFTSHAGKSAAVTVVKITRVEGMANSWALVTYRDAASVSYSIGGWGRFWY